MKIKNEVENQKSKKANAACLKRSTKLINFRQSKQEKKRKITN